jgi:anti-anti-sigma regulatory factor
MCASSLFLTVEEERIISVLQQTARDLDCTQGEVALDFSSVRRINPGAVRALGDLARVADDKAVKIVLRGVNVDVYKVLKLVKLTQRFSFVN